MEYKPLIAGFWKRLVFKTLGKKIYAEDSGFIYKGYLYKGTLYIDKVV